MPTEEQIRELAYSLWEQEGRPEGKDVEHYMAARRLLEEQEAAQTYVSQPKAASPAPQAARRTGSRSRKR
ncbi:MAG: DUF2934 domain-containing protein [Chloroflexi bacterium]|nr:DUF2934 domain-containing protein [Chloroflexota bacterium]